MRRRYRRRGVTKVVQVTQARTGYKVRPAKWLRTKYEQNKILACFDYIERYNYPPAIPFENTYFAYYNFKGNSAYDPYVGVANVSAVNWNRAFDFFTVAYCWKSTISIHLTTYSATAGFDCLIVPVASIINTNPYNPGTNTFNLTQLYTDQSSQNGIKFYTNTGGDKTNMRMFTKATTQDKFPTQITRYNTGFHQTQNTDPTNVWYYNVLFNTNYSTNALPQFQMKVHIKYYYVLMNSRLNEN